MHMPSAELHKVCADTIMNDGIKGFYSLMKALKGLDTSNNPMETLKVFATYATTYCGVSEANLAQFTGGNPETNQLWPTDPLSPEKCLEIHKFLLRETRKTYLNLDTIMSSNPQIDD